MVGGSPRATRMAPSGSGRHTAGRPGSRFRATRSRCSVWHLGHPARRLPRRARTAQCGCGMPRPARSGSASRAQGAVNSAESARMDAGWSRRATTARSNSGTPRRASACNDPEPARRGAWGEVQSRWPVHCRGRCRWAHQAMECRDRSAPGYVTGMLIGCLAWSSARTAGRSHRAPLTKRSGSGTPPPASAVARSTGTPRCQ